MVFSRASVPCSGRPGGAECGWVAAGQSHKPHAPGSPLGRTPLLAREHQPYPWTGFRGAGGGMQHGSCPPVVPRGRGCSRGCPSLPRAGTVSLPSTRPHPQAWQHVTQPQLPPWHPSTPVQMRLPPGDRARGACSWRLHRSAESCVSGSWHVPGGDVCTGCLSSHRNSPVLGAHGCLLHSVASWPHQQQWLQALELLSGVACWCIFLVAFCSRHLPSVRLSVCSLQRLHFLCFPSHFSEVCPEAAGGASH